MRLRILSEYEYGAMSPTPNSVYWISEESLIKVDGKWNYVLSRDSGGSMQPFDKNIIKLDRLSSIVTMHSSVYDFINIHDLEVNRDNLSIPFEKAYRFEPVHVEIDDSLPGLIVVVVKAPNGYFAFGVLQNMLRTDKEGNMVVYAYNFGVTRANDWYNRTRIAPYQDLPSKMGMGNPDGSIRPLDNNKVKIPTETIHSISYFSKDVYENLFRG